MNPLWPHQQRCLDALTPYIEAGGGRVVASAPTGAGKSRCMREVCRMGKPTAIYTHRRMLLDQMAEGLRADGIPFGFIASGKEPDISAQVQLCMLQTVDSKNRSSAYDVPRVGVVLDDEAHASTGEAKRAILDAHAAHGSTLIGWTATPIDLADLYDDLIVFAKNSELRRCGAHVLAATYAPSEIDTKHVRQQKVGEFEYVSGNYRQAVFGSVVEHWLRLNPERKPTLLFAPGVAESIWFAEQLSEAGITAAHIDGKNVWLNGEILDSTEENRALIQSMSRSGEIEVITNRFVMREGVDMPWLQYLIYATPMGSLSAYLQSGGRLLRSHPSHDRVTVIDHGGNWWRHGSLNSDREWDMAKTDGQLVRERADRIRKQKDDGVPEPIICPKCKAIRLSGAQCHDCGYRYNRTRREVIQHNGNLKEVTGDIFQRRRLASTPAAQADWERAFWGAHKHGKQTMSQVIANYARNHNWQYPDPSWPYMPIDESARSRRACDLDLSRDVMQKPMAEAVA